MNETDQLIFNKSGFRSSDLDSMLAPENKSDDMERDTSSRHISFANLNNN
jgi:hypothetical protein